MNKGKIFIDVKGIVPKAGETLFKSPINFTIKEGECWTIYGPNGSGKTLLSEVLCGRHLLKAGSIDYPFLEDLRNGAQEYVYPRRYIHTVGFQSTYDLSDFRDAYYQQRFNSQDADMYPTVAEVLSRNCKDGDELRRCIKLMRLDDLQQHRIVSLSSGQLRRMIIARALLENPKMMIFDNPYIGLDYETRQVMVDVFRDIMRRGVQLMFLIPTMRDIPSCTTHVLYLEDCAPVYAGRVEDFKEKFTDSDIAEIAPFEFADNADVYASCPDELVEMEDIDIFYGDRFYQRGLHWSIRKGEKWALQGPNGSGKSTLLSYIFADNPQAYSKNIRLFGQKRGGGESIWDIKKRIGFTSSEMHLYYRENANCLAVVESGFFDSVGLFRKCNAEQEKAAVALMEYLGLDHLAGRSFLKVSSGEQRLLLFARSIVKNPLLLILDEPFHGLDYRHKRRCLSLINQFASGKDKSLIFVTHYSEEIPRCVDNIKTLE